MQMRDKLMHVLLTFSEKCAKIMHFAIFLRNFLKFFENSPASVGLSPPDPPRGRPRKVFPPNENPGYATAVNDFPSVLFGFQSERNCN